jgi:hypothetical protein
MANQAGTPPLGTLTRHPIDWFSDFSYSAGYQLPLDNANNGGLWWTIALFNQDNLGRTCKVYGISVESDGGEGVGLYWVNGSVGTQVAKAGNLRPDYPTPLQTVWFQSVLSTPSPPGPPDNPYIAGLQQAGMIGTSGFDGNTVVSPFPLFIIPVGWSLMASGGHTGDAPGCWFWYQLANK